MARIGTRRALVSRPAAAGGGWWTIAGQTCVAAYAPKGAADLASSYINLANPGTYNAAPGTAPTFDAATGWTFTRALSQYLTTGITATNDGAWSIIVRYANYTGNNYSGLIHAYAGAAISVGVLLATTITYYRNGGQLSISTIAAAATLGVAGNVAYRNGSAESGTIGAPSGEQTKALTIGASNESSITHFLDGQILAIAIYSTTLSAIDVAALTTRMNAL